MPSPLSLLEIENSSVRVISGRAHAIALKPENY